MALWHHCCSQPTRMCMCVSVRAHTHVVTWCTRNTHSQRLNTHTHTHTHTYTHIHTHAWRARAWFRHPNTHTRTHSRAPTRAGCGSSLLATDVLWSDPVAEPGLRENEARGVGLIFGPDVTEVRGCAYGQAAQGRGWERRL